MKMLDRVDGPIPGENFTSDTRNYPWHRPPEYTSLDDAIEASVEKLTEEKSVFGLLSLLQNGMSVAAATDIFVTSGIGSGKWTPDFALLLAGPVARTIKMLADGYGIEYRMGIEDNEPLPSPQALKEMMKIEEEKAGDIGEAVSGAVTEIQAEAQDVIPQGGIGAPQPEDKEFVAPADEQDAMLGYGDDIEEETEEENV